MYSNKENVNILTALLVKHGVKHVVVCPGSRNAPIVHNLNECPDIECYPVTDERSAGFFAIGLSQVDDEPVAICVTSGSALLNVAPAAAEAFYQHRKIIIISADRPAAMIDQLQGQTLQQFGALDKFVSKSVNLPEPHDETEHWYCNRLVNEALIEMNRGEGSPVHINVPISEPLFDFTVEELPDERLITLHETEPNVLSLKNAFSDFKKAKKPMILIGQTKPENLFETEESLQILEEYAVVLDEKLGNDELSTPKHIDEALRLIGDDEKYQPDYIVYMGDTFVSKSLKQFLRNTKPEHCVIINESGKLSDVFMNATEVVQTSISSALDALAATVSLKQPTAFHKRWAKVIHNCFEHCEDYFPEYSQMMAVRNLIFSITDSDYELQVANSMSVRLALLYSDQYLYVNRGVNGIEGSLSTAVGFACGSDQLVYCIIGDLSFFYDQNALWNNNLTSNLRIMLLNNGGGGIFHRLRGLEESSARDEYIAASHDTNAEGICLENNLRYLPVRNEEEFEIALDEFIDDSSMVPIIMEVFTDPDEDERVLNKYYNGSSEAN